MRAEVIAIGDEVTSGQLLDTNTQWLSQRLEELGIRVFYHTAVGDELGPMVQVFRRAIERTDVILASGGLGPTADDLTRPAVAEAIGRKLILDHGSLEAIRRLFARRKRPMARQNEQQALLPEGGRAIPNPHGTAPGITLEVPREGMDPARVFALPGVPAEMREMWHGSVVGELRRAGADRRVVCRRVIKCFGAGESNVEAMLPDLIRRGRTPQVGINASQTTIILRITAEGATEDECRAAIEPAVATIRECLGTLVFGEGDDELEHAVVRLLDERDKTLAVAEWGTAGLVAQRLGDVEQRKDRFLGAVVVASETSLERLLDVPAELIARHTAASAEVVEATAASCRERFGADYGLAVSPFPRFDPAAPEPSPMFVGLADWRGVRIESFPYAGHPATLKILAAKRALNVVRLAIMREGVRG